MRKTSPAMFVALLALFAALGGVGMAATGDTFILGNANSADSTSALTATTTGPALNVTNAGNGVPLSLNSATYALKGAPPLKVNSQVKVNNLNADLLDGLNAGAIAPTITGNSASASLPIPNVKGAWTPILKTQAGKTDPHGNALALNGEAELHYAPAGQSPATPHLLLRLLINGTQTGPAVEESSTVSEPFDAALPLSQFCACASVTAPATVELQAQTYDIPGGSFSVAARSLTAVAE